MESGTSSCFLRGRSTVERPRRKQEVEGKDGSSSCADGGEREGTAVMCWGCYGLIFVGLWTIRLGQGNLVPLSYSSCCEGREVEEVTIMHKFDVVGACILVWM